MQSLLEQIKLEATEYKKMYIKNEDIGSTTEESQAVTAEDITKALNFECKWGKYKGLSYREIVVKDPLYFRRTVRKNLERVNPLSFTSRCFTKLCQEMLQFNTQNKENVEEELPLEPPALIRH